MPHRTAGLLVAVALVVTPGAAASAAPHRAAGTALAPTCPNPPAPAQTVAEVPWPQRRYAPERITPLATGAGVTVAVIDSGVDSGHPQLRGRVERGADLLDPGGDGTVDCAEHGTAVAGIVAAVPRRGAGLRGLAPEARIMPVRVSERRLDDDGDDRTVTATQFAQAVRWAVRHGADVLNLSVVLYEDHPAVRAAIQFAVDRDVVVVAAVGNRHRDGDPTPYPAAYPGVLGVGAIGPDGARADFSQVGPYVDVVAPGVEVLTAVPGGGHRLRSGTSYAVPFVSATAALLREYRPDLSARQVMERLLATADPAPGGERSDEYGYGVVNPYRAVAETPAVSAPKASAAAPVRLDPAAVAAQERRGAARERSLWFAAATGLVVAVAGLVAVVLPRGARRRWRPAA